MLLRPAFSPVRGVVDIQVVPGRELTPGVYLNIVHVLGLPLLRTRLGPEGDDNVVLAVVVVPVLNKVADEADAELDFVRLRADRQRDREGEGVVDVVGGPRGRALRGNVCGLYVLAGSPVVYGESHLHGLVVGQIPDLRRRREKREWKNEDRGMWGGRSRTITLTNT